MELKPHDLHGVFSDAANSFKLFDALGQEIWSCEMRNAATGGEGTGHDAECPPGTYSLALPTRKGTVPFGAWFIRLLELPGHHEFDEKHRAGIGIHGGGSGLADPFADHQGWVVTHGCLRVQNVDLREIVRLREQVRQAGAAFYVTVVGD